MTTETSRFQRSNENVTSRNRKCARCTSQRNRKYTKCISLQHRKPVNPIFRRDPDKRIRRKVERIQQSNQSIAEPIRLP